MGDLSGDLGLNLGSAHAGADSDAPFHSPLAFIPQLPDYALSVRISRKQGRQVIPPEIYDRSSRSFTHGTLTLVTPDKTICVGFNPKLTMPKRTTKADPDFGLSMLGQFVQAGYTLLKPVIGKTQDIDLARARVPGAVTDEENCYHDACVVYERSPGQIARAMETVDRWRKTEITYQAIARSGENCMTLIFAAMESAELHVPTFLKDNPFPRFFDAHISLMSIAQELGNTIGIGPTHPVGRYYPDHAIDRIYRHVTGSHQLGVPTL